WVVKILRAYQSTSQFSVHDVFRLVSLSQHITSIGFLSARIEKYRQNRSKALPLLEMLFRVYKSTVQFFRDSANTRSLYFALLFATRPTSYYSLLYDYSNRANKRLRVQHLRLY